MEHATLAGHYYTVSSKNGATITDPTGTLSLTVSAGQQLTVQAVSDKLLVDDEQAIIFKANFKHAALALRLLGGGDKLPSGYTRLDSLKSTGSQYIDTLAYNVDAYTIEYKCTGGNSSWRLLCYARSDSKRSYGVVGYSTVALCVKDSGYVRASNVDAMQRHTVEYSVEMGNKCIVDGVETALPSSIATNGANTFEGDLSMYMFASNTGKGAPSAFGYAFVYSCTLIDNTGTKVRDFIPALDPNGTPCMFDLVTREPFRNSGTGQFVAGMTLNQVRALRLPAGGGKLTLALPHEASIDRLAQAALERARANGWTLTLQYAEADVPAGYRKLDFLESTGTQYIDTGVKLSNESEVQCEFSSYIGQNGNLALLGASDTTVTPARSLYVLVISGIYQLFFKSGEQSTLESCEYTKRTSISLKDGEQSINGAVVSSLPFSEMPDYTALIYARKDNRGAALALKARVYSFSISREGEMQVDYVPCIAPDGKLGMYNKVDGTVKENAGSSPFIAGLGSVDDVRKLWLPETGGELTVSVPADTPDSVVQQLRKNNPTWQIAIQYRTDNEN